MEVFGLGRLKTWLRPLLLVSMLVLTLTPTALAGGSAQPTKILKADYGRFVVRPDWITPTGDGTAFFGGRRYPGHPFGRLRWKHWGVAWATATGWLYLEHCSPGPCNHTYSHSYVKLHAWRRVNHRFTRLSAQGPKIHQNFSLARQGRYWYWAQ
jgi:hypothetical protein